MADDNRPAILGIVEKALGGTGETKQEMVGDGSASKGQHYSESNKPSNSGKTTKPPGRSYSGSRKGPRKPATRPPSRPPRRP